MDPRDILLQTYLEDIWTNIYIYKGILYISKLGYNLIYIYIYYICMKYIYICTCIIFNIDIYIYYIFVRIN